MRVSPHSSGIATKIGGNEFEIDALRRAAGMARKHVDAYLARGRPLLLARRARHDEAAQTQLEVFVDSSTPSCERVGVGAGENKIRQRLPHRRHCRRFLCQERCRAIRLRRAVEAHALRWRRCAPGDALCPRHGRQHGRHKQRQKQRNYHRWRDPLRHPWRGAGRATPASPAPPPSRLARRAAPRASVRTAHARCGEAVRAAQPARARAPPCRRRRQNADAFLISSCQRMRCVGIEFDSRREKMRPALSPPSQQPLSKGRGALAFPLRFGAPCCCAGVRVRGGGQPRVGSVLVLGCFKKLFGHQIPFEAQIEALLPHSIPFRSRRARASAPVALARTRCWWSLYVPPLGRASWAQAKAWQAAR